VSHVSFVACPHSYHPSTPRTVLDKQGRIFVTLLGRPDDPAYQTATKDAADTISKERVNVEGDACHRRGNFIAVNMGVSFGGGKKACHKYLEHRLFCSPYNLSAAWLS
jgi:hypothetical protein